MDELAQLFVYASQDPAICRHFTTGTHAGLAVILQVIATAGHTLAAKSPKTYDHRSLWQLTADLDRVSRILPPPEPVSSRQPVQE